MARILAVLELCSNTLKMGISKHKLAPSIGRAEEVFLFQPPNHSMAGGASDRALYATRSLEC